MRSDAELDIQNFSESFEVEMSKNSSLGLVVCSNLVLPEDVKNYSCVQINLVL